jgi:hypothetical protein
MAEQTSNPAMDALQAANVANRTQGRAADLANTLGDRIARAFLD